MEPKDDSIKILEMRIRHQMNRSLENNIKPENIQYYLPSAAASRQADLQQDAYSDADAGLRLEPHVDENGDLPQEIQSNEAELDAQGSYEDQPFDVEEYLDRVSEMSQMMEHMEIPETKSARHAKARSGYERTRSSLESEKFPKIGKDHFFDTKG